MKYFYLYFYQMMFLAVDSRVKIMLEARKIKIHWQVGLNSKNHKQFAKKNQGSFLDLRRANLLKRYPFV